MGNISFRKNISLFSASDTETYSYVMMWFKLMLLLTVLYGTTYCYYHNSTISQGHSPLSKIAINEAQGILYVGGKNIFLQLNLDLQEVHRQILGPVNDSKRCKPFDTACVYTDFVTTDNYLSILKLYDSSFLLVCGTAHQGLCFKYNPLNITRNYRFEVRSNPNQDNLYMNFLGSSDSSVMHITKGKKGYDFFYVGQSYDGRNLDYFFKEFATLHLLPDELSFDYATYMSFLSVCNSKKHDFKLKFFYIFESGSYIFYVFVRSANVPGSNAAYDTRISRLCKDADTYSSYEEIKISCETATTTYNIGLSANFYNMKLYMSFGLFKPNEFRLDDTRGSAICSYTISEINERFDRDVLTACFVGKLHSPSWQCNITACPKTQEQVHVCNQNFLPFGIESNGDGILTKSIFGTPNELMTSVLPLEYSPEHIVIITGSKTGFLMKIQVLNDTGRLFSTVDVSENRNIEVSPEMVLDKDKNLYVLTGNRVTKLSMASCRLHQDCGDCVSSQDPLRCGWCFDHCSTHIECNHTVWHNQSCPPFIYAISPKNGPLEGLTKLIISGENFGTLVANASVNINNATCTIQTINDSSISCLTGMIRTNVSAVVKVFVSVPYSKHFRINGMSEQTVIKFEYMTSTVRDFFPLKGPVSGNTTVTITGENLNIGSSLAVMIGQFPCDIVGRKKTQIVCRTTLCKECPHIDGTNCRYVGELNVTLDGGISSKNISFCYMEDPKIYNTNKGYKTILSGGLNMIITGDHLQSVTIHSLKTDIEGQSITTTCHVTDLGITLVCPSPDLRSIDVKAESFPLTGQISVLLDDNIFYTTDITVNRDPELYYLDTNSQVKDIHISEKILKLQGKFLNSSLQKKDITILINHTRCPVLELQEACLRCDLRHLIHVTNVPLPVTASAGNWQRALGHIMFVHKYVVTSKIPSIVAGVILGVSIIMMLCLIMLMQKKHIGCFRKKEDLLSVVFYNTQEEENFLPSNYNMDEQVNQQSPRYVHTARVLTSQPVEGAANDSLTTTFDGEEITDILIQQNIYIERDRVRLGQDIGHGNFGCVYKGFMLSEEGEEILVAVKTVLKAGTENVNAFLDEAMIMKDFKHPNVLSLIGISTAQGEFPLVILPFMQNGDLLSYVRNAENKPTVKHLVSFALDVARGMEYLGGIKFVHRDLAARNCMLDDNLKVKVADFGLARDIYSKNYYSSDNKKMLPVKWMAPESLENGTYSTQSDVWSFGVLLWELMTRGSNPYSDVDNWDMLKYLESGRRMKRPQFCPTPLYDIMLRCWELEPEKRLSFSEINQRLTELMK